MQSERWAAAIEKEEDKDAKKIHISSYWAGRRDQGPKMQEQSSESRKQVGERVSEQRRRRIIKFGSQPLVFQDQKTTWSPRLTPKALIVFKGSTAFDQEQLFEPHCTGDTEADGCSSKIPGERNNAAIEQLARRKLRTRKRHL